MQEHKDNSQRLQNLKKRRPKCEEAEIEESFGKKFNCSFSNSAELESCNWNFQKKPQKSNKNFTWKVFHLKEIDFSLLLVFTIFLRVWEQNHDVRLPTVNQFSYPTEWLTA